MSRNEEAWKEVSEKFGALGKKFREHYESTAAKEDEESAPSSDDIKKAFDTISDGLERVFGSLGAAVRDEQVKAESKAAASALVDALGATVEDLGVEVRKRIKGDHAKVVEEPEQEEAVEAVEANAAESGADEAAETLREDLQDDA